jgi:hypothetical protein
VVPIPTGGKLDDEVVVNVLAFPNCPKAQAAIMSATVKARTAL